jgi:uncharacterized protein (TIGR02118 family)
MVKLSVLYYALEGDEKMDEQYYHENQVSMALDFLGQKGCKRLELGKAILGVEERTTVGWKEPFHRMTQMWFDDIESARGAIYSDEMRALDEHFRNRDHFKMRAGTFFADCEQYDFSPQGLVAARGPWAERFASKIVR